MTRIWLSSYTYLNQISGSWPTSGCLHTLFVLQFIHKSLWTFLCISILLKANVDLLSNYKVPPTGFDTQTFSRTLLHATSGSGFLLKVLMQFMKPITGCEKACGTTDKMLQKMCFLGRLQNIKNVTEQSDDLQEDGVFKNNDILMVRLVYLWNIN